MTITHPSTVSGRKPKGGGPARREEILAHALHLFSEHGVHTVSTRQIADAVGISQPSLYAYFPTKQALVDEVCARAFAALEAEMQAVVARASGETLMTELARVYIDFGLSQPDAYRVAFMIETKSAAADDGAPDPALMVGLRAYAISRDAIGEAFGAGLDAEEIELMAQSLWASLHGLVSLMIARPAFPWGDRERLIDYHIRRLRPA
jgi:AcrR family transcriptional regulator